MTSFLEFVLAELPPPPARVLEVGCGTEGGLVEALLGAGYQAVGVDPDAPDRPPFRQVPFEDFEESDTFDAAVASRVFHHVARLEPVLDKVAELAPLLVMQEFAWERIDVPTQRWYEAQRRRLEADGEDPSGPLELDEWRARHMDLHPATVVLRELESRYETQFLEERPYFHLWLEHPATEAVEAELIARGEIQPIGVRYTGVRLSERPDPRDASPVH